MSYDGLAARLAGVRIRIAAAQRRGGWTHPVSVIGVTKGHDATAIAAAYHAGLVDVGENRVQEALAKQEEAGPLPLRWHLIGSLQRKKVKQIAGRFEWIHSVDRLELVSELARWTEGGRPQRVLVEVNCSGEAEKAGADPSVARDIVEAVLESPTMVFDGLMTMAALTEDRTEQRRAFGRLRGLKEEIERAGHPVHHLSMGMSGDFEAAVEEGATMVRLGTILFGEREP